MGQAQSPRIQAVILDMDGLMLDTEPISFCAWRDAAAELGLNLDEALYERMVGLNVVANAALLRSHFGEECPADDLTERAQVRYRQLLDEGGVPHKPGLTEFIRFLDERKVPRAVATSTATELAREKLRRAGVLDRLDVVVGGDQVAHGKPDPDIFLSAASQLGVPPARCAVLEDSAPGIKAAVAAGMVPILIPDGRSPAADVRRAAHAVVDSLDAARALLEEWL